MLVTLGMVTDQKEDFILPCSTQYAAKYFLNYISISIYNVYYELSLDLYRVNISYNQHCYHKERDKKY